MSIRAATEDDIPRILEIENETIAPPWTHGALLGEIYRDDCFFAVSYVGGHEARPYGVDDIGGHEARTCGFDDIGGHEDRPCRVDDMGEHEACPCGIDDITSDEPDHGILGFVILRQTSEDEGELLQIAVDKTARRCGIADMLMDAALRYSEEHSIGKIFLEVRKGNETAIALYKKHGFVSVRVRKDYYSDPTEDAVVMARGK